MGGLKFAKKVPQTVSSNILKDFVEHYVDKEKLRRYGLMWKNSFVQKPKFIPVEEIRDISILPEGRKTKMIDKFLDCMKNQGWTVEMNEEQKFCLPEPMKSRYTGCPESWMEFVSIVKSMIRGDEGAWFLCSEDYDVQGDKAWQWNEWELVSLEAAGNDAAWKDEIRKFRL